MVSSPIWYYNLGMLFYLSTISLYKFELIAYIFSQNKTYRHQFWDGAFVLWNNR